MAQEERSASGAGENRSPSGEAVPGEEPVYPTGEEPVRPAGEVYDWYRRGLGLLERGDAGAAAELLHHARAVAPDSASVREALARALFDSGRHEQAAATFRELVTQDPGDDYARFGLGLSLSRLGRFEDAVEQLALAVAMRPHRRDYTQALGQARATLRARAAAAGE
jgi:tetratricopeptide (TPR) repeat protein